MAEPKKKAAAAENAEDTASAPEVKFGAKELFDEWRVDIPKIGEFEKVKLLRTGVTITPEQAETLNAGVAWGGNSQGVMYFKPE